MSKCYNNLMFDLISKSKVRRQILKILFSSPDKEFYLSEIAKKIDASVGNCQRELEKMVRANVLTSQKKVNLRVYSVDRRNPFYRDLQNIINKTIGIEEEIRRMIRKISGVRFAFIFGSYAKGELSSVSDIDLFIIGKIDEDALIKKLTKSEKSIDREINYHIYSEKEFKKKFRENSFLQNIVKNYILLTNNKNEFKRLLR